MDNSDLNFVEYHRKSSEADDRQTLSIGSQKREMGTKAKREKLNVVAELDEEASAYVPGREKFRQMIELIKNGKANAILTYHLTRLARNSMDGGEVIYLLDCGLLKAISTPEKTYTNTADDKFMMQIAFAMAKKSSDDTSDFVKRDIKAKLLKGEYPCFAPIGFLNIDPDGKISGKQYRPEKQQALESLQRPLRRIEPDPFLAPIIRQLFESCATRNYSLSALCSMAEDMGMSATRSKRKVSKTTMERILKSPLYFGAISWKGEIIQPEDLPEANRHLPIVSKELFDLVQEVLTGKSHIVSAPTFYSYSAIARCGTCQGYFSGMTAKGHKYYRCVRCREIGYLSEKVLEDQVLSELGKLSVDPDFVRLAVEELGKLAIQENHVLDKIQDQQDRKIKDCQTRISNLLELKISAENIDGSLISTEQFVVRKNALEVEMKNLKEKRGDVEQSKVDWFDKCVKYFDLTVELLDKYPTLSPNKKREVFQFFYYNPVVSDKILLNPDKSRYEFIVSLKEEVVATTTVNFGLIKEKTAYADAVRSVMRIGRGSNPQLLP